MAIAEDGKGYIARLEAREKERTGIGSLKVRFNKVFGYFIEVTKANLHAVPADYERRQTTVGGERFITPELKGFEEKVLTAEERRFALEQQLFEALRQRIVAEGARIRAAAAAVAVGDVLLALARLAAERGYTAWGHYGQSKLANLLFAKELARRFAGFTFDPPDEDGIVRIRLPLQPDAAR